MFIASKTTYYMICKYDLGWMIQSQHDNRYLKCPTCGYTKAGKSMISMEELLNNKYNLDDQSDEIKANLAILLERINMIRAAWGKPMVVTSGLRTVADQIRIYADKGITDESKIPMGSMHIHGGAVDIYDPDLSLTQWLKDNPEHLQGAQLWCELGNKNWLHAQITPPKSGNRWFLP